ncbi:hypothetical protein BC828DRAFT_346462, partial [Blastocladiella britannica]
IKKKMDSYDFDGDTQFQAGLTAILARVSDPSERGAAVAKAKLFYYQTYIKSNDQNAHSFCSQPCSSRIAPKEPEAPPKESKTVSKPTVEDSPAYPPSFAEIVRLVSEGLPVPGVRDIPTVINPESPTAPVLAPRPKPWESTSSNAE